MDFGWLLLKFKTRENIATCFHADENVFAILDGYLTGSESLSDIVVNLIKGDTSFINHLTGSFFLCFILPEQKKLISLLIGGAHGLIIAFPKTTKLLFLPVLII